MSHFFKPIQGWYENPPTNPDEEVARFCHGCNFNKPTGCEAGVNQQAVVAADRCDQAQLQGQPGVRERTYFTPRSGSPER